MEILLVPVIRLGHTTRWLQLLKELQSQALIKEFKKFIFLESVVKLMLMDETQRYHNVELHVAATGSSRPVR